MGQTATKGQMSKAGRFYKRLPDGVNQAMLNEKTPEAIRAFIEIATGKIRRQIC